MVANRQRKLFPLPDIPEKRYFSISEASILCGVKPHVLRYWEQEFPQLEPLKRRGNRRYYQHRDILLARRIRELLYEEGYTIQGAREQLQKGIPVAEEGEGRPAGPGQDALLHYLRQELQALLVLCSEGH